MALLFAQANGGGPPDEILIVIIAAICGFYLVLLLIGVFFLLTLSRALARCSPRNRTMEPGMVWLNLIPLFSLVWMFITAVRVSESLDNEFYDRGWHRRGEEYGKTLGIVTCSLLIAGNIPYCGVLFSLAWLVCWIIYWVKIAGFSRQLLSGSTEWDDDYDDDDRNDRRDRRGDHDDRDDDRNDRRDERDDDRGDRKPWERR